MSSLSDLPEHNFPKQYMLAFASLPHARVQGPVRAVPDPESRLEDLREYRECVRIFHILRGSQLPRELSSITGRGIIS